MNIYSNIFPLPFYEFRLNSKVLDPFVLAKNKLVLDIYHREEIQDTARDTRAANPPSSNPQWVNTQLLGTNKHTQILT